MFKRYDFLVINRSLWPKYSIISTALLTLLENKLNSNTKVALVAQCNNHNKADLYQSKRSLGIKFFLAKAFSDSASSLMVRIFDSLFFMLWVFVVLIITRPKNVYISTDPPVIVPFIVALYSKLASSKFVYHVQDIHPEATNLFTSINIFLLNILRKIDNFTLCRANQIITLNEEMKAQIILRSKTQKEIKIISNPSVPVNFLKLIKKRRGFFFTGNLGRFQRIPLLLDGINEYFKKGGKLKFVFVGGGIYANKILEQSKHNPCIKYFNKMSFTKAAIFSKTYEWALAPIDDQITKFAFPSKLSTYACTGAKILAICGEHTSVAQWIRSNQLGVVVKPKIEDLVEFFFQIEKNTLQDVFIDLERNQLKKDLSLDKFVNNFENFLS